MLLSSDSLSSDSMTHFEWSMRIHAPAGRHCQPTQETMSPSSVVRPMYYCMYSERNDTVDAQIYSSMLSVILKSLITFHRPSFHMLPSRMLFRPPSFTACHSPLKHSIS
ncbi:hypothetical protein Tcan_00136 [Toxocara canis]|uniref:Uncharacterized protein n=1 Tax=Toxocara canis TaxID=6265 RepID=A0A0B2VSR3_TOXCA|nr:hypothetical protein Tcan_00136 [Toxocara canis]